MSDVEAAAEMSYRNETDCTLSMTEIRMTVKAKGKDKEILCGKCHPAPPLEQTSPSAKRSSPCIVLVCTTL